MCLFKSKLTLSHPEEPEDKTLTIENVVVYNLIQSWFDSWAVPLVFQPFWLTVDVKISEQYSSAGATIAETKQTFIRPEWANTGVLAHEMAHISYSLTDKSNFSTALEKIDKKDKLLKLLFKQKLYSIINIVETYADIYRYLGGKMPEELKGYYPLLF